MARLVLPIRARLSGHRRHHTLAPTRETLAPTRDTLAPTRDTLAPYKTALAPYKTALAPFKTALAPMRGLLAPLAPTRRLLAPLAPYKTALAPTRGLLAPLAPYIIRCQHTSTPCEVTYIQGQSPQRRIREYFYYIDHQGMLFLDDARIKNFTSCFKAEHEIATSSSEDDKLKRLVQKWNREAKELQEQKVKEVEQRRIKWKEQRQKERDSLSGKSEEERSKIIRKKHTRDGRVKLRHLLRRSCGGGVGGIVPSGSHLLLPPQPPLESEDDASLVQRRLYPSPPSLSKDENEVEFEEDWSRSRRPILHAGDVDGEDQEDNDKHNNNNNNDNDTSTTSLYTLYIQGCKVSQLSLKPSLGAAV
ncbi:hypothetical protein Pmani_035926 [Petrolisthes manimaculis]|uniref:Uncharacterized protein n=1 Tax=Petrolisthes manimaculis TaxID=1843537 RepID=A0AAE1NM07_9EUCA|nr:hypothetical protein Pmani_035926 [Petrolisthes manimaculis]